MKCWEIKWKSMDIIEFLEKLPNNSIDIFITSPPYNLKNKGGDVKINTYKDKWDNLEYEKWQTKILNLMGLKLKSTGAIFYNHKNRYENNQVISPWKWVLQSTLKINQCIIWDRISSVDNNRAKFKPISELVFWLYKDKTFKLKQEAVNFNEIWKIARPSAKMNVGHNATFPPTLINRILLSLDCDYKGKFICDPFCGSGTVAQVAQNYNFDTIIINDKFFNKSMVLEKLKLDFDKEELPKINKKYLKKDLKDSRI